MVAGLIYLLIDLLDKLKADSTITKEIRVKSSELIDLLEPALAEIYDNNIYSKSTIMQELANKIETTCKITFEKVLN